jgi:hypothetical protein
MMGLKIPLKKPMRSSSGMVLLVADDTANGLVRTTSVANLDSRLLVTTSDLAKLKARNMTLGDAAFNVDEYIARLVSFMGGRHHLRAAGRNEPRERDEDMDWTSLGHAAMGICRRPPTVGFMLGPLSVEKKERKVVRRQAERRDNAEIVRPQEVSPLPPTTFPSSSG